MSTKVPGDKYRIGLFRHNQFRNPTHHSHWEMWPDILRAYRRYRGLKIERNAANLLTIGYADGRRHGPVITTMVPKVVDNATYDGDPQA